MIHHFAFGIYPYIAMAVFFIGSWVRFDRDQYTWKSDSSQLLRAGQLRWGSNLFHVGILFLFFGHTVGMLTPHFVYEPFISAGAKQLVAMISGGAFGVLGLLGLTLLLHRRLSDVEGRRAADPDQAGGGDAGNGGRRCCRRPPGRGRLDPRRGRLHCVRRRLRP